MHASLPAKRGTVLQVRRFEDLLSSLVKRLGERKGKVDLDPHPAASLADS